MDFHGLSVNCWQSLWRDLSKSPGHTPATYVAISQVIVEQLISKAHLHTVAIS